MPERNGQPVTRRTAVRVVTIVALTCATLLSLSGSTITAPQSTPGTTKVMARIGLQGSTVMIIQRVLHLRVDGIYSPETTTAVRRWQQSHHLRATGVVDPTTWSQVIKVWVRMPAVGNDVSWPQCPKGMGIPSRLSHGLPMPPESSQLVLIGLTNGPAFYPNPCLASQTAWAKAHHMYTATYAITTYPTPSQVATYGSRGPYKGSSTMDALGNVGYATLANTGYAQAMFNIASMHAAGLHSRFMWVDVEPYPTAPWSKSTIANKAVVDGALSGYRSAGFAVGFYSTKGQWPEVLGSAAYGLPEWRTAGLRSASAAVGRCASTYSFQGGSAILVQWWGRSVDYNITCPSANTPAVVSAYFHRY